MNVVGHHAPWKDLQTFIFLTISKAVNQDVFVNIPGEDIPPFHNRKAYEVSTFRILEFILPVHEIKIKKKDKKQARDTVAR